MEENKEVLRFKLSTFLLTIAIIVIFVMGCLVFTLYRDKKQADGKIRELEQRITEVEECFGLDNSDYAEIDEEDDSENNDYIDVEEEDEDDEDDGEDIDEEVVKQYLMEENE